MAFAWAAVLLCGMLSCGILPLRAHASTPSVQVAPLITDYAGSGAAGNGTSGTATSVAIDQPNAVAVDTSGNLYVADSVNLKVRRVDTSGNMTTLALSGPALVSPQGVAVDASGTLYVADQVVSSGNIYGLVYKYTVTGSTGTLSATIGQPRDGSQKCYSYNANTTSGCTPANITIENPAGMAFDASGNLYLADFGYSNVLKVNGAATAVSQVNASLASPIGLAIDASGSLYIAEYGNSDVKKIDSAGTVTVYAGGGASCPGALDSYGDGCLASQAKFSTSFFSPRALAIDSHGSLYISDTGNNLVRVVTPDGYIHVAAGGTTVCAGALDGLGNGCPASLATLNFPIGIATDAAGDLYIADQNHNEVRKIAYTANFGKQAVNGIASTRAVYFAFNSATILGTSATSVTTQGAATLDYQAGTGSTCTAGLHAAASYCVAPVQFLPRYPGARPGAVRLANALNQPQATAYLTGLGSGSAVGFNPPAASALAASGVSFASTWGMARDGSGNMYVADASANTVVKIAASGATASTLSTGGIALAGPEGVAVDGAGNVYIADTGHNQVVEVPASGTPVIAISGTASIGGAKLSGPNSLITDAVGNLYVSDAGNARIVSLSPTGNLAVYMPSSVLFNGVAPGAAGSIAVDGSGNLYITFTSLNEIGTYAPATGSAVFLASGTPINGVGLATPQAVAVDPAGNVYVADTGNNRVVEVTSSGQASVLQSASTQIAGLGLNQPIGLTTDASGNVFVADNGNKRVVELDVADNPTLNFGAVLLGASNTQSISLVSLGNQTLRLQNAGLSFPGQFAQATGSGSPADCGSAPPYALAAGLACNISIKFSPLITGSTSGSYATVNDDALGSTSSQQRINLSGTGQTASYSVTIQTSPAALQVTVDGTAYTAPITLSLAQGSHAMAVASTIPGSTGTQYIFNSWSDGTTTTTDTINVTGAATYMASFSTQYQLTVNAGVGGTAAQSAGPYYASGATATVTATASSGHIFANWSGPVASSSSASTTVTMSGPQTVSANFTALQSVTVTTAPAGLAFTLDGKTYLGTKTVQLTQGSTHTIAVVSSPQAGSPGTQYVYSNWSDGGAQSHSITVGSTAATYTAGFSTQYQLTVGASSGGTATPASGSYYSAGAVVPLSAAPGAGYVFSNWTGLVANPSSTGTSVTMSAAQSVAANFAVQTLGSLVVAGYPATVMAGSSAAFTVTAYDQTGALFTGFAGTVSLSSTDAAASFSPPSYTFGAADAGRHSFGTTLNTSGTQSITASSGSVSGMEAGVQVLRSAYTFPATAVGSTSATQSVTLLFAANAVLNPGAAVGVLTQGAAGLDFANAGSGTCVAGASYTAGQTCTVAVNFAPRAPGQRAGAVLLYDNSAMPTVVASAFLSGVGTSGLVAFAPGVGSVFSTSGPAGALAGPHAIAADAAGDLYVGDSNRLLKVQPSGNATVLLDGTVAVNGIAPAQLRGVTTDGAGTLYAADAGNNRVLRISAGGAASVVNVPGIVLSSPQAVAVDGSGDLYIADTGNRQILRLTPGGTPTIALAPTTVIGSQTLTAPSALAIDTSGNLYLADALAGGSRIVMLAPNGTATEAVPAGAVFGSATLSNVASLAVDAAADIYITDSGNSRVVKATATAVYSVVIPSSQLFAGAGLGGPAAVALDGLANIYVADSANMRLVKLDVSDAPAISFGAVNAGQMGTQTVTFSNAGNAPLTLTSAAASPSSFSESGTCSGSVVSGGACALTVAFSPATGTPSPGTTVNGTLTLTDSALNSAQVLPLTATALSQAASITAVLSPAPIIYGQSASIQFSVSGTPGQATPAGSIAYSLDGGAQQSAVLAGGSVTVSLSVLAASSHAVVYSYSGDGVYSASATATLSFTVNTAVLTVTAASPNVVYGQPLPAYTSAIAGFVNGDAMNVVSGAAALSSVPATPAAVGTYTITAAAGTLAAANYSFQFVNGTLTITQAAQTITFPAPASPVVFGSPSIALGATASSGLPVNYAVTGPATGSSSTLTITGAGTVAITASQAGDANHTAAASVARSITVNKAAPVLTWAMPATITYGTALSGAQLNASATGAGGAALPGTFTYSPAAGVVLSAGTQTLSVTFTPTDTADYSVATQTVSLQVNKVAPVLTWAMPVTITYGTALSGAQLNAAATGAGGAALPGTFAYSPAAGVVLSAGTQTLSVTFTPTDTADYSVATQAVSLHVNKVAPVLTWATPATITYGTALSGAQLNASATGAGGAALPGTFTYSPAAGVVLSAGVQTLSVTFTPTDSADYSVATQTVSLQVNIGTQTIAFAALPSAVVYGAPSIPLSATTSSGLPVSYAVSGPGMLSGASLTVTGVGTVTVTATEAGDANYSAAPAVAQSFTVTQRQLTATVTGVSFAYGQPAPAISGTLTGVLAKDAGSVGAVYTTLATSASAVGAYPITVTLTGPAAADYSVQVAATGSGAGAGAVTVTPAPLSVNVNNVARGYGLANPAFTGTIAGVVNNDQIVAAYTSAAISTSPVGTYPITATLSGAALRNYSATIMPGSLTVTGGTLSVMANNASRLYGTANPAFTGSISGALNGDVFTESFNTQATLASPAGTYGITPVAAGANLASYTVNTVPGTLTVNRASSSVVLSSTATSIGTGASLTFTAGVSPSTTGLPTGTVSFYDGTTVMGSSALVGGTASYTTSFSAGGLHPITAAYSGDGNFLASASAVTTETAIAATYTLTATTSGITVRQGASGAMKLTVESVGNYIGRVDFACSGLPAQATCSVDPSSLSFSGNSNASQTATLTLQTLSPQGITGELHMPGGSPRARGGPVLAAVFWLPGALLAGFIAVRSRSLTVRIRQLLVLVVMAACVLGASGCSGKFFTPTPLGTSTITVTAGPAANQRVTFTLTVN